MSPVARRHLVLLAAPPSSCCWRGAPGFDAAEHLVEPSGLIYGASYADVYGRMPAALLLMVVALVGAALAAWQAFGTRNWLIPAAIGLYLLVSIGGEVYSSVLQRFIVTPNEQVRETPFIEHNIAATRRVRTEAVEERPLSGDALLTRNDIANNCGDPRERQALGSPAAARDVRSDPGDPPITISCRSTTIAIASTARSVR